MATSNEVVLYRPRPLQAQFHETAKRWNVVVCHRRFGKTVMGVAHLILAALKESTFAVRNYAFVMPTYKQAKLVAWDYLKRISKRVPGTKLNESELFAKLATGGTVRLFGADNPDSLRGIFLDGVLFDEYDQMKPELFGEIIRPCLADRNGFAVFMGTPKGQRNLYELKQKNSADPEWNFVIHKASETGYVKQAELDAAKKDMSRAQYEQEFECDFNVALNGDILKREFWRYYSELPAKVNKRVHSWDTAFKTGEETDFTAGAQAVECDTGIYLTGMFKQRVAFPELKRVVRGLYDLERPDVVLVEDKASGQSLIQELRKDGNVPVLAIKVDRDKVTRAHAAAPSVEAGNVWLPENAPWVYDFVEECAGFPNLEHDDQVDALTQLINWVRGAARSYNVFDLSEKDKPSQEKPGEVDDEWFDDSEFEPVGNQLGMRR